MDISTKSPKEKNNVIPLVRVLEAKPVGILIGLMKEPCRLMRFFCLLENFNRLNERDCVRSEEEETTDRHERTLSTENEAENMTTSKHDNKTTRSPASVRAKNDKI